MAIKSDEKKKPEEMGSSTIHLTSQFDPDLSSNSSSPKKLSSQGESDSEASSSVCGSASSETSSLDQNKGGTEWKKTLNKSKSKKLYTLGSFRSSRRREKSRFSQPSKILPDDDSSPQHRSSVEVSEASPNYSQKSAQKFTRTTSLRTVRIFRDKNKTGSKSKRPSIEKCTEILEDSRLERATFSSTLKDTKFPKQVEPQVDTKKESEKCSVMKICPYQHCSLHGHHHHHEAPTKRFAYLKKSSGNKREETKVREREFNGEPANLEEAGGRKVISTVVDKKVLDFSIEFYAKTRSEPLIGSNNDNHDADFADILFGAESFQDNLNNVRIDPMEDEDSSEITVDKFLSEAVNMDLRGKEISVSSLQDFNNKVDDKISTYDEKFPNTCTEFSEDEPSKIIEGSISNDFGEATEDHSATTSASNSHSSEESIDTREEKNGDSKANFASLEENKNGLKKDNHISMWHMIHRHMVSGLAAEPGNKPPQQADDVEKRLFPMEDSNMLSPNKKGWGSLMNFSDSDKNSENNDETASQDIEVRKIFAIKLVREAIEKILLPEVQDDQSVTSEVLSIDSANISITSDENNFADDDKSTVPNQEEKTEKPVSEKRTPKSWSYLKKVILLKRFVKELEKVKQFNPKKPRHLPLEPEPEAETVSLRPQTIGEKKNSDKWMLDYAIRQVVTELAPTQKRKVALLVRAFETVAPAQEDQHMKVTISKDSPKILTINENDQELHDPRISSSNSAKIISSSNSDLSEQLSTSREQNKRESEPEGTFLREFPSPSIVGKLDPRVKGGREMENHMKMWHMIYRHVATDIAEKVGTKLLLDGADGEDLVDGEKNSPQVKALTGYGESKENYKLEFSRSDAVKLVQEAVDEILRREIQDDSLDTQSISSEGDDCEKSRVEGVASVGEEEKESAIDKIDGPANDRAVLTVTNKLHQKKSKNWSKLKKFILLKRSIKALENVRKLNPQAPQQSLLTTDPEEEKEKVDLRRQMMDERKKAEEWMLDYAVQHIVTKLTPDRKRRVAMLVEAFEAVVPLPEI